MAAILDKLINVLPMMPERHSPGTPLYDLLADVAREQVERHFSREGTVAGLDGLFRGLDFPYHEMGAINSLHLFGLDELILFSFYQTNRQRYRKVLDLGANIGLHSLMLDRCGFEVRCYEPDPVTFGHLKKNLERNHCQHVTPINRAVSTRSGELEFTRVLGNLTGSHLSGAKANPYGEIERFKVEVDAFQPLLQWADFCKIDVEGHEKEILLSTVGDDWKKTDAMIEIGTRENAEAIYEHMRRQGVSLFAQKRCWKKVDRVEDLPSSYKEGSVFITCREEVPWTTRTL